MIGDSGLQTRMLKLLAESASFTSDLEDVATAINNVYQRLMDFMPLPPDDVAEAEAATTDPDFEFTKVECLLSTLHILGRQKVESLNNIDQKDFRYTCALSFVSQGVKKFFPLYV